MNKKSTFKHLLSPSKVGPVELRNSIAVAPMNETTGFKEASGDMPVITPNFINPEAAENAVKSGQTDMISLGRQAIADPFWPVTVKEGRVDDIVKCALSAVLHESHDLALAGV